MDTQRIDGLLVAVTAETYDPFPDRQNPGQMRPGGVKLRLFLSTGFDSKPIEVTVPERERLTFDHLREAGQGARVSMIVDLIAKGGGNSKPWIERRFTCLVPVQVEGNGAAVPVPVGADAAEPF